MRVLLATALVVACAAAVASAAEESSTTDSAWALWMAQMLKSGAAAGRRVASAAVPEETRLRALNAVHDAAHVGQYLTPRPQRAKAPKAKHSENRTPAAAAAADYERNHRDALDEATVQLVDAVTKPTRRRMVAQQQQQQSPNPRVPHGGAYDDPYAAALADLHLAAASGTSEPSDSHVGRMAQLLRWRRQQRNGRSAPHIPPRYLPHYAKHLSPVKVPPTKPQQQDDITGSSSEHRGFRAQQSGSTSDFQRPQYEYCHDGIPAIPASTNFSCNFNGTAVGGYTAAEVSTYNATARAQCQPDTAARACLCPRDSVAGRTVLGDTLCFWLQVQCAVQRIAPSPCPAPPVSDPMRLTRCTAVPRRSTLTLAVNVTCEYLWANPKDYAFFGIELIAEPTNETFIVLNTTNRTQPINAVVSNATAPFGSYRDLSDALFIYNIEPATSVMPLTAVHPFVEDGALFRRVVNFNRLSDLDQMQTRAISDAGSYSAGDLVGQQAVVFNVDLSNVSDAYVTASRLYMEAGVRAAGATLFPESVQAASFTIDFSDVVEPTAVEPPPTFVVVIVVSVLVGVALIVALVAFGVWRRNAKPSKPKQD